TAATSTCARRAGTATLAPRTRGSGHRAARTTGYATCGFRTTPPRTMPSQRCEKWGSRTMASLGTSFGDTAGRSSGLSSFSPGSRPSSLMLLPLQLKP
ncbi:hypothetical protein HK405_015828, partial [Cladochytrium tenue]